MQAIVQLWQLACSRRIVSNALKIAVVVGTLLNLINQGSAVLHGAAISWVHFCVNFLLPYAVATYSAVKNQLSSQDEK